MQPFLDILKSLHERCRYNNHRGLVILSGQQQWTETTCADITAALPELQATTVNGATNVKQLLGTDTNSIIFNAFSGFNLNAIAITAGTIKGGGLMILQCPPLASWQSFDDPEYQRLLAHPFTATDVTGLFLNRLSRILAEDSTTLCFVENQSEFAFELPAARQASKTLDETYASVDQQVAVDKIIELCRGRARRPLLITADRGRGKSAALGLAAATLLADANTTVTVTAPSPKAIASVTKHANNPNLKFVSPDELLDKKPDTRLLLIDEAAAIPLPLLENLVSHYARVVLTTTVHGYEGTGRAFQLRFSEILNRITPNWRRLEISEAVRFASNDPLEALIHRALILDPELDESKFVASEPTVIQRENRKALASNEQRLRAVFGLLMLAHYQTTPDDLRHMLDAPNIDVFTLSAKDNIIATALVAKEGVFDEKLIEKIHGGERRPKGHLLPQTLIFQCNLPAAGALQSARVIRIAVLPSAQRHGFGRQLLTAIEQHYKNENFDLIGTSFGLEPGLLNFWQAQSYHCVRVGSRRNAASTYHSALLIKPLGQGAATLSKQALKRFTPLLIAQLPSIFKKLDPHNIRLLLATQIELPPITADTLTEARSYISKKRNRQDVVNSLQNLLIAHLGSAKKVATDDDINLLIASLLQQRPDQTLCQQFQIAGVKSLTAQLRGALQKIMAAQG